MADFLTVIDFSMSLKGIKNLKALPLQVQNAIKSATVIDRQGFQTINGRIDRRLVFSAGGHYTSRRENAKFIVTSIGWHDADGVHWGWDNNRNEVYRVPAKTETVK